MTGSIYVNGRTPLERLLNQIEVVDDCWLWRGQMLNSGYGVIVVARRRQLVHRLAHEMWLGPIPPGHHVDHICRHKPCVNPDHLEAVTPEENNRRAREVHVPVSSCRHGHPYTPENTAVNRAGQRLCLTCRRAYNRRVTDERRALR